jgi:hypothetical protein
LGPGVGIAQPEKTDAAAMRTARTRLDTALTFP